MEVRDDREAQRDRKEVYESEDIIAQFKTRVFIQKPEQTILSLLRPFLSEARVLDIGVGAGRTTRFFTGVPEYVGIDLSAGMIEACQEKYRDATNMRFLVCDVRDMSIFPKESFDIVLFSFNGIDCLSHEDRLNALREIQRVLKTNAFFMFSAHNLQFAPRLFRKVQVRPIWWTSPWGHLFMNMKRRKLNPEWHSLAEKNYAIIDDGTYDWRLGGLYYVDPQYQVTQLHNTGFSNVRIFSLTSGLEITLEAELKQNRDWWLYYLCQQGPQSLC